MHRRTLVLTGLSGAGKSTVAARLATQLGVACVDLDAEIEARAGQTIPMIFQQHGEAWFRDLEARVLAEALAGPAAVIATGGGALVRDASRALALEQSTVVWLRVSPRLAAERCTRSEARPLLAREPEAALQALLDARQSAYAEAHLVVDTDGRDADAVAAEILRRLEAP